MEWSNTERLYEVAISYKLSELWPSTRSADCAPGEGGGGEDLKLFTLLLPSPIFSLFEYFA